MRTGLRSRRTHAYYTVYVQIFLGSICVLSSARILIFHIASWSTGGNLSQAMRFRARRGLVPFQFSSVLSFLLGKIRLVLTVKLIIEAEAGGAVLSRRSSKYTSWRSDGGGRPETGHYHEFIANGIFYWTLLLISLEIQLKPAAKFLQGQSGEKVHS
jgi:hypothetical protein